MDDSTCENTKPDSVSCEAVSMISVGGTGNRSMEYGNHVNHDPVQEMAD